MSFQPSLVYDETIIEQPEAEKSYKEKEKGQKDDEVDEVDEFDDLNDSNTKDIILVYVYNLPPWIKWRDLKHFLINYIDDSTILHIQIWPNQINQFDLNSSMIIFNGIISVNSIESSLSIYEILNNYDWNGYLITVNLSENDQDPLQFPPLPNGSIPTQIMNNFNYGAPITPLNSGGGGGTSGPGTTGIPQQIPQGYTSGPIPSTTGPPPSQYYNFIPYYPYQQPQPLQPPQPYLQPTTILSPPPSNHQHHPSLPLQYQIQSPLSVPPPPPPPYGPQYQHQYQHHYHHHHTHGHGHKRTMSSASSSSSTPINNHIYPMISTPIYSQSPRLQPQQQQHQPPRQLTLRQLNYQDITDINDTPPDRTRLFIGNIPFESDWKDLKDFLRRSVGDSILRVEIPRNENGSKGFGIAIFQTSIDAKRAIDNCNGVMFQGRPLTVRYDKFPKPIKDGSINITTNNTSSTSTLTKEDIDDDGDDHDHTEENIIMNNKNGPVEVGIQVGHGLIRGNHNDDSEDVSFDDGEFAKEARNLVESLSLNK